MTKKEYNGWRNYETWKVALWIDNEHYYYEESRGIVAKWIGEIHGKTLIMQVADELQEMVEEDLNSHGINGTLLGDLAWSALAEVDWDEIATNIIEEE